jgi:hypothetical protein
MIEADLSCERFPKKAVTMIPKCCSRLVKPGFILRYWLPILILCNSIVSSPELVQAGHAKGNSNPGTILQALPAQVASLTLAVGAAQLPPGGQTSVTITAYDTAGQPVSGAPITLFSSWGALATSSSLSNTSGQVTTTFTAGGSPGQAVVTALSGYASASATVKILPPSNQPPAIPHSPQPADGMSNLSPTQTLTLTWQGGDADGDLVAYILAFGESNPPPVVANSLMGTRFEPLLQSSSITYYWSVTATDGIDERSGPVWSFSVAPPSAAPYMPFNPVPADGATNVSLNPTLSWEIDIRGGELITYTVAFGTFKPPPIVATRTVTSYNPAGLISNTTYYWAISTTNGITTGAGPVWQFSTGSDHPYIYLPIVLKHGP